MIVQGNIVTKDMVVLEWLRSERWKMGDIPNNLLDNPDLNDPEENLERLNMLRSYRSFILDTLPDNIDFKEVRIQREDLPRLYILSVYDWFMDTGRTFQLANTIGSLQPGRTANINGSLSQISHFHDVMRKIPYIESYDPDNTDEHIVIISTHPGGPWTIIDGTHRASALLSESQRNPNYPWKAFLITSPNMSSSHWHVESPVFNQKISELTQMARSGLLT